MTITPGKGPLPSGVTRKPDAVSVPLLKERDCSAADEGTTDTAATTTAGNRERSRRFMAKDPPNGSLERCFAAKAQAFAARLGYRLQRSGGGGGRRLPVQRAVAPGRRRHHQELEAHEAAHVGVSAGAEPVGVQADPE